MEARISGPAVGNREPRHRNGIKAITKIRAFMDKKSVFWTGVIGLVIALIVIAWLTDPFGLAPDGQEHTPDGQEHAPDQNGHVEEPQAYVPELPDTAEVTGLTPGNDTITEPDPHPDTGQPTWRPAELFPATRVYQGPDFELEDLDGSRLRLSDYEGRIIVLNLWATWCPPCRDEVPALIRLQEEYGDRGVQVIGVSLDENGARQKVADFAQSFGVNYPTPVDDGRVQEKYGPLSVIPTTYILDGGRNIRFYAPGYLEYAQMEAAVEELLND
ncbi:MAG: TlpA family protein disulfide reductase [Balneolaceae bacterium]|nr:MAG: TlpA family protein disulfide reductase [Balneolaceae bacterium]